MQNTALSMAKQDNVIGNRVVKQGKVDWQKLDFIQSDSFKELPAGERAKLKQSIRNNDFVEPFKVWEDRETGKTYCLDGKHRTLILQELMAEGVKVLKLLPADFIACSDIHDAAKLVLTYSSQYARITESGLTDFLEQYKIPSIALTEEFSFPGLPVIEEIPVAATPIDAEIPMFFINIECEHEEHCQQLYERFTNEGLKVKIVR